MTNCSQSNTACCETNTACCTNTVEGIGVTPYDALPASPISIFTQVSIPEVVCIPCVKPPMEDLLSILVEAKIISVRLIKTPIGVSFEGQRVTGWKLSVELELIQKVKYVADEPTQSVHAAHFKNIVSSIIIVVPDEIPVGGALIPIEDLFRANRLVITPYIEDIYGEKRGPKEIFKNITVLLNVTVRS